MKIPTIDDFKSKIGEGGGYANPSLFYVSLPVLGASTGQKTAVEFFVKSISLPSRSMITVDRELGTDIMKVPYGYQNDDITMTFLVMNDHLTRHYIETWQQAMVRDVSPNLENNYRVSYPDEYLRDIRIFQLDKGTTLPLARRDARVNTDIININLGATVSISNSAAVRYTWHIMDAFPIAFQQETLSNDASGTISEITATFSYRKWKGSQIPPSRSTNIDVSVGQTEDIQQQIGGKILNSILKRGRRI